MSELPHAKMTPPLTLNRLTLSGESAATFGTIAERPRVTAANMSMAGSPSRSCRQSGGLIGDERPATATGYQLR